MINKADYQVLAVALREGKKELLARGLTSAYAQEAVRVLEEHISQALRADNPRFDPKLFEQVSYPYPDQEGVTREEARAYSDELDDGEDDFDYPLTRAHIHRVTENKPMLQQRLLKELAARPGKPMPLDPRAIYFQHRVEGEYRK